jgi:hypothetical protein
MHASYTKLSAKRCGSLVFALECTVLREHLLDELFVADLLGTVRVGQCHNTTDLVIAESGLGQRVSELGSIDGTVSVLVELPEDVTHRRLPVNIESPPRVRFNCTLKMEVPPPQARVELINANQ